MRKGYQSNTEKIIVWTFITLPVLIMITLFFYQVGQQYEENNYQYPQSVEDQIIETRLLYNPNCFAHERPSGRPELGVLDPSKVTKNTMQRCISTSRLQESKAIKVEITNKSEQDPLHTALTDAYQNNPPTDPRTTTYTVTVKGEGTATALFRYK